MVDIYVRLLVRILPITPNDGCQWDFGIKFGCHWTRAMALIRHAVELELNVVGVRSVYKILELFLKSI